ncbi:MAG: tryptophan synthase subunit alpha [Candidatus Altiarchaeota archaeon]
MNRIDRKFIELKKGGEKAFIGFITAGDPNFKTSLKIANAVIEGGVDILELGLPFSDPIADGSVIQKAGMRSLDSGMNTDKFFIFANELRKNHTVPLICMTYYNLLLHRGLEEFASDCRHNGIDGLIIPDLPVEESKPLLKACRKNKIHLIFLVAPTTTKRRLKAILKVSKGFVYVVSVRGITGVRKELSEEVKPLIERIRKVNSKIPLAVGFGVSNPHHVKSVAKAGADAAIVGSAIIKVVEENLGNKKRMLFKLQYFARELKNATPEK